MTPGGSRRLTPSPRSVASRSRESRPARSFEPKQIVLPILLVAIVVAATVLAHLKVHHTQETGADTAVALTRTLSCVQDFRAAKSQTGTVPVSQQGVETSGDRVTFAPAQAASGYAVQSATGKTRRATWLAGRACPSLGDDWWFVGVGSSVQHDSVLTLDNPEPVDATFDVTVYGPSGPIEIPGGFPPVPAGTSRAFDLANYIAASTKQFPNPDLSIHVTVTRGLVAASMRDKTWALTSRVAPSQQWVPSASAPSKRIQLMTVPGVIGSGTSLVVANPGSAVAVVSVKAINTEATFTPTSYNTLSIPPGETMAFPLGNLRKVAISSLVLTSKVRITATLRSVQGTAEAYAVPAQPIGAESTAGIPVGIPATLQLTADRTSSVTLLIIDAHGATVKTQVIRVAAGRVTAVPLPKNGVALRLAADRRSSVMAAVSLSKGGIAMIGMVPTANVARVPAVSPLAY